MEDVLNISWNIDIKSIKKRHIEQWWDKENPPKKPTIEEQLANPSLIQEKHPDHR